MTEQTTQRRQYIEQQRGQEAWNAVKEIAGKGEKEQKEYRSLARGLNAMIQINGLGQTLGFLKAKGKVGNVHHYLLGHLTHWMHEHFNADITDTANNKNDGLLDWILRAADSADYRRATTEVMAYGAWLRRFAEAELKEPDAGEA